MHFTIIDTSKLGVSFLCAHCSNAEDHTQANYVKH